MGSTLQKFFFSFFFFISSIGYSQLQITNQTSAQALAQRLVGEGVSISNVSVTGSEYATGFFKNLGGTNINLDSGIVISTGRIKTVPGFLGLDGGASGNASTGFNLPGDAQLQALVSGPTGDAAFLEFDFIPLGDTIKFNYVFSSEEYPEFACSNYNDVFAFFISGPGITGVKNIALVPGTNIPVAINSINAGTSPNISVCQSMGPGSPFTQYFVNNQTNTLFTHDGHTRVLTAISKVTPCQTYHLKIAIADVFDRIYDSNVFLEAHSLKSTKISIINANPLVGGVVPYLVEGCVSGSIKVVRNEKMPNPQPINLYFGGTAVNGVDIQPIPTTAVIPANDSIVIIPIVPIIDNIAEGIEYFKIYVSNGCVATGVYTDSIQLEIRDYDTLAITPPNNSSFCRNTPVQLTATNSYSTYQWSPAASLSNATIHNPVATPDSTITYICTANIGTCNAQDSVRLIVKRLDFLSKTDVNCANGTTGVIKVSGGIEWGGGRQYSVNGGIYSIDSTFSNLPVGTHIVRIKDASGCIDSIPVTISQAYPNLVLADSIGSASCSGTNGVVKLTGSGGLAPYQYSIDGTNYTPTNIFNITGGPKVVYVKDANGCVTTKNIVVSTDQPITTNVVTSAASCNGGPDGSVTINASGGNGTYEYSVDGVNYFTTNSFNVNTGALTIYVRDNKGCTHSKNIIVPLNVSVTVNADALDTVTICEGTGYTINATTTGTSVLWSPAAGLSNPTIVNPVASPTTTTTYYVTATKDICSVVDSITVIVLPAPVANAGTDSTICYGKTITLMGSGGVDYIWEPANVFNDPSSATPSVKPSQTTIFTLRVVGPNGCSSVKKDSVKITVTPPIQAFAGRDTFIAENQPLQLFGVDLGNRGVTNYTWSPSTGLNDPNIHNPIAVLDVDIVYVLTMSTPEGCEGSDEIKIRVFKTPDIYVPSAFTPNRDGKNDVLRAIPVGIKEFRFFRVYNRWGQLIFSTTNPGKGWDGAIMGKDQATGVFIWITEGVDFTGKVIQRKGSVTLIR